MATKPPTSKHRPTLGSTDENLRISEVLVPPRPYPTALRLSLDSLYLSILDYLKILYPSFTCLHCFIVLLVFQCTYVLGSTGRSFRRPYFLVTSFWYIPYGYGSKSKPQGINHLIQYRGTQSILTPYL